MQMSVARLCFVLYRFCVICNVKMSKYRVMRLVCQSHDTLVSHDIGCVGDMHFGLKSHECFVTLTHAIMNEIA